MTIRKLWLLILILVSVLSVGINSLILTTLTDKYFKDYLIESYDTHINQIIEYTQKALTSKSISYKQMEMELETHLTDPIIGLKLYNPKGELLIEVEDNYHLSNNMMSKMMTSRMNAIMSKDSSDEMRQYNVFDDEEIIGVLNISLHSIAENSFVAWRFKESLLFNSLISIFIVSILVVLIGLVISKKMSKSLRETARMASDIQMGETNKIGKTTIREVNAIRESLEELDIRLKLKQKSRKALIDELLHQTRTPLTILKSHIEAIEDGLIEVNDAELEICQIQISNITSIIYNLSGMIDANKDVEDINIEEVEIGKLLNQIVSGLMPQFNKKSIELEIVSDMVLKMQTDKYKLSQAIFNLLTNAYKYTESLGTVVISYGNVNGRMILKIQDTGIGISEEDQKKIFNAYYRGNNHLITTGDGIGLYIVNENVTRLGGRIKVESKLNVGSTFEIDIPINCNE